MKESSWGCLCLIAHSLHHVTTLWSEFQWILKFGRHVGFNAEDTPAIHHA
jgi:hypothetical protein